MASSPFGLALALLALAPFAAAPAHAQDLLVTDEGTQSVLRYNGATGNFVSTFASGNGLTSPVALAFGPDGNLYVDNNDGATNTGVLRFNGTTGAFMNAFVPTGGLLNESTALAFGPDGDLYVANGDDFDSPVGILRYNGTTGAHMDTLSLTGLQEPMSMAFGPDGALYVGNGAEILTGPQAGSVDNVLRIDPTTGVSTVFAATGNGLVDPNGLAFGADGNLYVSNEGLNVDPANQHTVLRYDGKTGAFKDVFVPSGSGGIKEPFGLAFGPGGSLFVASGDTQEVYKYDGTTGGSPTTFVTANSGGLTDPKGVAFFPRAAAVPEPSSFALLGLGLLPLGLRARRRAARTSIVQ